MKLYLFAIGGTGARVVRSLTMMLASGIEGLDSSVEIVPVIIDYDLSNADKTRTINLLQNYTAIHNSLYPAKGVVYKDHFFMTTLTPLKNVGIQGVHKFMMIFRFILVHRVRIKHLLNIWICKQCKRIQH